MRCIEKRKSSRAEAQRTALKYNRPMMRRFFLIAGPSSLLISVVGGIAGIAWIRSSGPDTYEEVIAWMRIMSMIMIGLLIAVPLVLWAATGINLFRTAIPRAFFPLLGFPLGVILGSKHAEPAFYEVSAQIIPVLLLVLGIEFRAFVLRRESEPLPDGEELFKFSIASVVVVMMGGEGVALAAIARQKADVPAYAPCVVAAAVAMGFLAVLMYSVLGEFGRRN